MRIGHLLVPLVLLLSCGDDGGDRVPAMATFEGTYDAKLEFTDSFRPMPTTTTRDVVGIVRIGEDGALWLGLLQGLWTATLSGTPSADGTVDFRGDQFVGDVVSSVRGTAQLAERDGVLRVTGAFDGFFEGDLVLVMTRPIEGVTLAPDGAWSIAFTPSPTGCDCSSRLRVALTASRDGACRTTDAFEVDDAAPERLLTLLSRGSCLLSPEGRLELNFHWQGCGPTPETFCTLNLGGVLEPGGGGLVGAGVFGANDPVPGDFDVTGSWTAARINNVPGTCGNGIVEPGEDCELPRNPCRDFEDDGGTITPIACSSDCLCPATDACGDGRLRTGEACDDGNRRDGDGCNARCLAECGTVVCAADEQCCSEIATCMPRFRTCPDAT